MVTRGLLKMVANEMKLENKDNVCRCTDLPEVLFDVLFDDLRSEID